MTDHIVPNKSLGQHWLHDKASLESMADGIDLSKGDEVLEIGPGLGTLTDVLLDRGAVVTAVEFDDNLARQLQNKRLAGLTVVNQDILKFDLSTLPKGYKIAANIPYYLTNNLLRLPCETTNHFSLAALLVQKEVAERANASPGNMSVLSISLQYYCEVSLGRLVGAELFTPPPKVDSQILLLKRRPQPLFDNIDDKKFFRLVKVGFSQKRKKLRSSLSAGLSLSKDRVDELCASAGLSSDLRAQNLSIADWHKLYLAVYS